MVSLNHGIYRYCKPKQNKNSSTLSQRHFSEHDCLKISYEPINCFHPWQGGQADPRELNFSNSTWSNFLPKSRNCLSNSLLYAKLPDTMIKDQNLNGQVPQTLDAIICQISASQAAKPINFLRVACPHLVETLRRYIKAISILRNQSATSVRNGNIVGNGDINFVTPLSQAVLTLYLAWCLFRIIGISHIPRCYGN